jgi:isoleucyl-tRNA synthetase
LPTPQAQRRDSAWTYDDQVAFKTTNLMDKWLLSSFQSLVAFVMQEMAAYRLYTVIPRLLNFVGTCQ